jgi:hypothetical protein
MSTSTAQEIESDQRKQRRQIREDAELMETLVKHPGWPRYLAMIEAVGQGFQQKIMAPLESVLEATKPEFAKGALTGLSLAAQLPHAKMREAKELSRTDDEE